MASHGRITYDGSRAGRRALSERLPPPDPARVAATAPIGREIVHLPAGTAVLRVHALAGPHASSGRELRSYGPTKSRYDHHPPPRRDHPTRAIAYLAIGATAFTGALAEYFQDDAGGVGPIDLRRHRPAITIMTLVAEIALLDLDSGWVTRAGGNQAIRTGPRGRSRDWARAIYRHHRVDGLTYRSSVWGPGRCVALWERGAAALPSTPIASRTLDDPHVAAAVAASAAQLGTFLV